MKQGLLLRGFIVLAFLVCILSSSAFASPLDNWHLRNTSQGSYLAAVTYGGGVFVAVGYQGIILTSSDGTNWTSRNSGSSAYLTGIAYGNGVFVAVGRDYDGVDYHQVILVSDDGTNWSEKKYASPMVTAIAYGNNTFVAVGDSHVAVSHDGLRWTFQVNVGLAAITYGNEVFAAIGSSNFIATSPDGIAWSSGSIDVEGVWNFYGITYGNGLFVAVGASGCFEIGVPCSGPMIVTSPDAIAWTYRGPEDPRVGTFHGVSFGKGFFAAVGGMMIETSSDGIMWSPHLTNVDSRFNSITYGHNSFVAVGPDGAILQSDPIVNECAVTVSSDLSNIHIPILDDNGTFIQGDMVRETTPDGSLVFRVTGHGEADPGGYADCPHATFDADSKTMHLPSAVYRYNLFWADMELIPSTDGEIRFKVKDKGLLGDARCSASLSSDLNDLHIPFLEYKGNYLWGDLVKEETTAGSLVYRVTDYGAADSAEYAGCRPATLSGDLATLSIPSINKDGDVLWAELEIRPSTDDERRVKVVKYGKY